MAFSSLAISYLLGKGVSKPIIFTGLQIPLSKTRNDAQCNLIMSITIAAMQTSINEVVLYFDNKLVRVNQAVKISASAFHAFESPNYLPLRSVGIDIQLEKPILLAPPPIGKSLDLKLNLQKVEKSMAGLEGSHKKFTVISIMLYLGMVTSTVESMLQGTKPP